MIIIKINVARAAIIFSLFCIIKDLSYLSMFLSDLCRHDIYDIYALLVRVICSLLAPESYAVVFDVEKYDLL
jgi:hypothetical protein